MRTEEQVVALFVEHNPIPDIDMLDVVEVDATRYLTALQRRSSNVTELRDVTTEEPQPPTWKRFTPMLIAAVVIAILGLAWVLLSQGEDASPVATNPTPTTSPGEAAIEDFESFRGFWAGSGIQIEMEGNLYFLLEDGEVTDQGTFTLLAVSDRITFSSNSDSLNCSDAAKGTYEYAFSGPDTFQLTLASDDCDLNRGLGQGLTLNRTEPFSVPPPAEAGFDPPDVVVHVQGDWERQLAVLRFDGDQYTVFGPSGEATDQGTVRFVPGAGLITFVSSDESANCEPESAMTGNYRFEDADTMVLSMTSENCLAGRGIQFSPNDQTWTRSEE